MSKSVATASIASIESYRSETGATPVIERARRVFDAAEMVLRDLARVDEFSPEISPDKLKALESQESAALARQREAIKTLLDTPSQSLEDAFVKLVVWQKFEAPDVSDYGQFPLSHQLAFQGIDELSAALRKTQPRSAAGS